MEVLGALVAAARFRRAPLKVLAAIFLGPHPLALPCFIPPARPLGFSFFNCATTAFDLVRRPAATHRTVRRSYACWYLQMGTSMMPECWCWTRVAKYAPTPYSSKVMAHTH